MRVFRVFVGAAKADKPFVNFDLLGGVVLQLGFIGEILSDRVCAEIDAARKNFALLKKEQVAGFSSDIQEHGAIVEVTVIVAKCIAQSRGRDIGDLQMESCGLGDTEKTFDDVSFDSDEQNLKFAAWG